MTKRLISYSELKEAISVAFDGDDEIFELYDPNVRVVSVEEIVEDVFQKITEYDDVTLYSVYEKNELIGYFVSAKRRLISFGLNVKFRITNYLNEFYELIKKELGDDFFVLLWCTNTRAIKWLMKNNMTTTSYYDHNIIKLQCL